MIKDIGIGQITVVIPTYGHAQYIRQALDSLLSQTRPAHRIVVVNDESPDDTDSQVEPYLDRIMYIKQAHGGLGRAVWRGFDLVETEYVHFMASDDWMAPNAFSVLAAVLDQDPQLGVAYGGRTVVEGSLRRFSNPPVRGKYRLLDHAFDPDFVYFHPSILWRAAAVDPDPRFRQFSLSLDWAHWIEAGVAGWSGYAVADRVGFYRRHSTNTSRWTPPIVAESARLLRFVHRNYGAHLTPGARRALARRRTEGAVTMAWWDVERGHRHRAQRRFRKLRGRGAHRLTVLLGELICAVPPPWSDRLLTLRALWHQQRRRRRLAKVSTWKLAGNLRNRSHLM